MLVRSIQNTIINDFIFTGKLSLHRIKLYLSNDWLQCSWCFIIVQNILTNILHSGTIDKLVFINPLKQQHEVKHEDGDLSFGKRGLAE
jgi:hypothetical protein